MCMFKINAKLHYTCVVDELEFVSSTILSVSIFIIFDGSVLIMNCVASSYWCLSLSSSVYGFPLSLDALILVILYFFKFINYNTFFTLDLCIYNDRCAIFHNNLFYFNSSIKWFGWACIRYLTLFMYWNSWVLALYKLSDWIEITIEIKWNRVNA